MEEEIVKKVDGESIKIGATTLSVSYWITVSKKTFVDKMTKAFEENKHLPPIDLDNAWLRMQEHAVKVGLQKKISYK